MSTEEAKVAELIGSLKDGRFRLDQYLFGLHDDRRLRLQDLCNMLRSNTTNQPIPMDSFLSAHPERPLSLDELLNISKGDVHVQGSIHRQSITSLRSKLSLLPTQHADRSGFLIGLGDALLRRFSEWAQKDDLEEAIWSYKEVLSHIPKSHYYYLEALLGLCSSLYQRYYLLGHADDLKNLLLYLDLQCDILDRQSSLLAPVEVQLCPPSPILNVTKVSKVTEFKRIQKSSVGVKQVCAGQYLISDETVDQYEFLRNGFKASKILPTFNWSRYLLSNVPPDRPCHDRFVLTFRLKSHMFITYSTGH